MNRGDLSRIDEVIHPEFINHEAADARAQGPEGYAQTARRLRAGFSDLRLDVQDVIADGDRVAVRLMFEGTHDGPFLGMAATGRRVSAQHIHIFRVQDGLVAEHWACRDDAGAARPPARRRSARIEPGRITGEILTFLALVPGRADRPHYA